MMSDDELKETLLALETVPDGSYDVGHPNWFKRNFTNLRGGWLAVDTCKNGDKSIMWTTHKDSHQPLDGKALSITFKSGKLKFYMESALSMWIKWDMYGRGGPEDLHHAHVFSAWVYQKLIHDKDQIRSGPGDYVCDRAVLEQHKVQSWLIRIRDAARNLLS